jgi:spore coat polysaccharide biosynthesis predicted glycosyltransferase SpsG
MNFFFRVDSSSQIVSGHVIRCLILAKALTQQGAICKFICGDHKNSLIKIIKKEDFEVAAISHLGKIISPQRTKDVWLS